MELLRVIATAYCLTGTTATGAPVHHGAIATDPNVIPLHSRIIVPGYGAFVGRAGQDRGEALDTGSAVNGYHIDLWMASCADARRWGARRVTIKVRR